MCGAAHGLRRLGHGILQPIGCESREPQQLRALLAQVLETSALDDTEYPLLSVRFEILAVRLQGTFRPLVRAMHRFLLVFIGFRRRGALVEREHDVRADPVLDLQKAVEIAK